jgi:hypothetical protein
MARKSIANALKAIDLTSSENDPATKPMHTAQSEVDSESTNMHTAETVDAIVAGVLPVGVNLLELPEENDELFRQALLNANINHEQDITMSEIATQPANHSNPDPRKNSLVSNVHISNTQMRLESENAILAAMVNEIDRKIAELQAERTDLTGAIAMNNAGLAASEKL